MQMLKCLFLQMVLAPLTIQPAAICQVVDNNDISPANGSSYHLGLVMTDSSKSFGGGIAMDKEGLIYISTGQKLFCLNGNGTALWAADFSGGSISNPVLADSVIYLLRSSNKYRRGYEDIFALNLSGDDMWTLSVDKKLIGDPIIAPDGNIYIQTQGDYFNNGVFKFSKDNQINWLKWPEDISNGKLLGFNSEGNLILWENWDSQLHFLSENGELLRSCRAPNYPEIGYRSSKVIDYFYFSTKQDFITTMNADCIVVWSQKRPKKDENYVYSTLFSQDNGSVFVATTDGEIMKYDAVDGSQTWKCNIDSTAGDVDYMILSPNGILFAATSRANLHAIDSTGQLIWSYTMYDGGRFGNPLSAPNGDLYITQSGCLYKFTTDSSQIIQPLEPAPLPATLTDAEGEIADFILQDITEDINSLSEFIKNDRGSGDLPKVPGLPEFSAPKDNLIVYCRYKKQNENEINMVDPSEPISSWLCDGGTPRKGDDTKKTIKQYSKRTKDIQMIPWTYGIYNFTISYISENYRRAEVLSDHHCGFLCGNGYRLYLQRSPSGKWWIVKSVQTWIS